jgi:hypothetical protein
MDSLTLHTVTLLPTHTKYKYYFFSSQCGSAMTPHQPFSATRTKREEKLLILSNSTKINESEHHHRRVSITRRAKRLGQSQKTPVTGTEGQKSLTFAATEGRL